MSRSTQIDRTTRETAISGRLDLDGTGEADVATGLGFLDHMLTTLAKHAAFDLELRVEGDLGVDDHHTVEDCAIVLGRAVDEALGDRVGIARFGFAYAPLDEALCRAVVDLSGRGWAEVDLAFTRETIGEVATENLIHFFSSLAIEARMALHIDQIRGVNNHHIAEAAFKAVAQAVAAAVRIESDGIRSTKGGLR
ncbi:MAG: imidazoleglycerol-phosphate dehydratase HisB [Acidimicrobiia bacterium]|nr:MAG: imidazoleglycerol-phosphate dehydratase HisB [Acidimicrobiia bacterium]